METLIRRYALLRDLYSGSVQAIIHSKFSDRDQLDKLAKAGEEILFTRLALTAREKSYVRLYNRFHRVRDYFLYIDLIFHISQCGLRGALRYRGTFQAVQNMVRLYQYRVRDYEDFYDGSVELALDVTELIRFMFAKYPVPPFMETLWYQEVDLNLIKDWVIYLGQGGSPRRLSNVPVTVTKRMVPELFEIPKGTDVNAAFRRAQLKSFGFSNEMVHQLMGTFLAREFHRQNFWGLILEWMAKKYDAKNPVNLPAILDYINYQKFGRTNRQFVEAPNPNFSVRGRTLQSLMRLTLEWHEQLRATDGVVDLKWSPMEFGPYKRTAESYSSLPPGQYVIRELTTTRQLIDEGNGLNHCVASYAGACAEGRSAIWSLREFLEGLEHRLVTIEVDKEELMVVQIRAKDNDDPEDWQLKLIREWAWQNGMRVDEYATC